MRETRIFLPLIPVLALLSPPACPLWNAGLAPGVLAHPRPREALTCPPGAVCGPTPPSLFDC